MTATETERKTRVMLTQPQRFDLTERIRTDKAALESGDMTVERFITDRLPPYLQFVTPVHIKGVCKAHGITLPKVDRSIQSIEKAMLDVVYRCEALQLSAMDMCEAALVIARGVTGDDTDKVLATL